MKLSELVERAENLKNEKGDLDVFVWGHHNVDGCAVVNIRVLDEDIPEYNLQEDQAALIIFGA